MAAPENATARLARLLTMVPWLVNRQGVDIQEAARELGVSPTQIEADLQLLFLCGTPGHMPDDLIEAEWEEGRVYLRNADTISRPLRLSRDEALSLIVGLRTLGEVPGLAQRDAIDRALAKLIDATGESGEASARVQVTLDDATTQDALAAARRALADRRRLHLRYLVASRDESTERDVDPMRLVNMDSHWYLEGWCHRAQEVRLFRMDRVERSEVLDVDGTPPAHARPRDLDEGIFTPAPQDLRVVLDVDPAAAWVAEYYPVDDVVDVGEGRCRITLRATDSGWVRSLVWRLGGHARVVEPESLARDVEAGAAEALSAYGADSRP
ncbi:WYL domain-containing protein [Luteipulveratus sp. YIM 133132]|uniref:helix-turn-helix transcriptional regulator n=1 Tax=Luteipulveratus flavus TaxID=3031728 RepID=UPI0023AE7A4E|nr:WYL domain-containing protein [Luteipulveratus sp. YIM 133132]MDE9367415.1 WYL domain-containing protein [Luteipulveratus sp. YIM 133132]